jgi:hypothetical protein
MEIKVVQNLPRPVAKVGTYPFAVMKIGDGFKYPFPAGANAEQRDKLTKRVRAAAASHRKSHPDFVYETETVDENDKIAPAGAGICVYRVALKSTKNASESL